MSNKKEIIDLINDNSFSDKEAVEIIENLVGSIEHEEPEKPTEKQLFGGDRLKKISEIESKKLLNDEVGEK